MTTIMRAVALVRGAVSCPVQAFAQQYPNKPVKIIIPFPAGGVTDLAGRLIAQKLSEKLGQQFYIENIGGAGGNLGMAQVARAPGDGYTVLLSSSSVTVNPSLYNKMPFDVEKDLIPVTKAGGSPNSWLVNPDFPAKNMKDLIDLFKKEPGKYSVGSPGAGTTPSLSIEQLKHDLKVNFVTVPFAGGGPMTQSLLGGHVPISCGAIGNSVALIKDGKIRALGITDKKRLETLPDIPTLDEMGIKDQEAETMTGVFVPAGTPKEIVDLLQKEIAAIVKSADIKAQLLEIGVVPEGDSPESFAAYVKADIAKWKRVIEQHAEHPEDRSRPHPRTPSAAASARRCCKRAPLETRCGLLRQRGQCMKLIRRNFLRLACGAIAGSAVAPDARAQSYPARPIRLVVSVAAGGTNDVTARMIAQKLSEAWKPAGLSSTTSPAAARSSAPAKSRRPSRTATPRCSQPAPSPSTRACTASCLTTR